VLGPQQRWWGAAATKQPPEVPSKLHHPVIPRQFMAPQPQNGERWLWADMRVDSLLRGQRDILSSKKE